MDLGQRVVSSTVAREEEVALEFTQASLCASSRTPSVSAPA